MKDNKNDLISPEIVKLTEKMAKDPVSTLFFPLAEEYRKCDMLDEAIILLTDGLKNHPNFLSARVSLGKIYLQKGLAKEAKLEFEKVIKSAPDNLLAQKKLTLIYRDEGDQEKTLESCRRLLLLNPNDEEIKKLRSELEERIKAKSSEIDVNLPVEEVKVPTKPEPLIRDGETIDEPLNLDHEVTKDEEEGKQAEEDIEPDSSPVYEIKDDDLDLKDVFQKEPGMALEEEVQAREADGGAISDIFQITQDEEEKDEEIPVYEIKDEEVSLDDILVGREKVDETRLLEEEINILDKKGVDEKEVVADDLKVEKKDESNNEEIASEALAELYIRQEEFDKAIEILNIVLSKDPSNERVRQKVEDAVTLKNLMGGESIPMEDNISTEEPPGVEKVFFPGPSEKVQDGPEIPGEKAGEAISTVEKAKETNKNKKIKKLEQWLENIRRSRGNEL